ncbi:MAG: response regulator [Nitrospinae bacterium]|nr:response regulator [Nitrospinota bacterium]
MIKDYSKLRALVVEDLPSSRTLEMRFLRDAGISELQSADNGTEAIRTVAVDRFDLILLDWELPHADGMEVLKAIRGEKSRCREAVVIMVTGVADKDHVLQALKSGADDYIVKPFSLNLFVSKIRENLKKREG